MKKNEEHVIGMFFLGVVAPIKITTPTIRRTKCFSAFVPSSVRDTLQFEGCRLFLQRRPPWGNKEYCASSKESYPSIMLSMRSCVFLAAASSWFVYAPVSVSAFSAVLPQQQAHVVSSSTGLNLFGNALKGAFSNDDSLGKKENAGIKGGPKINEVTINGKPVKAVANQKVSQVLAAARTKVTYSCKKGDCGTCEIQMDGRIVKACQAKIPQGKCTINTF